MLVGLDPAKKNRKEKKKKKKREWAESGL